MARALTPPRPPLPRFAVAWFPAFRGIDEVEAFRGRHDPTVRFIPAHVSLVFPFPTALKRLQLETHVRRVAAGWPPVPVSFRRARTEATSSPSRATPNSPRSRRRSQRRESASAASSST